MNATTISSIADRLIVAGDRVQTLAPITAVYPRFGPTDAYEVLLEINRRREAAGWRRVGRKIGFTNRSMWPRYGVDRPMWAPIYSRTTHHAPAGHAEIVLDRFVQPRVEPEIVFGLRGPVPVNGSMREVMEAIEWCGAGFEIVQCHFPDWKFTFADCTAAFGLHACLVVGAAKILDDSAREQFARGLPDLEVYLVRGSEVVGRGRGSNVLGNPALALQHLARVIANQPQSPPLTAGEIVTTGTLTDAHPVEPGTRWRADLTGLPLTGLSLELTGTGVRLS